MNEKINLLYNKLLPRYLKKYDFRFATEKDYDRIIDFIDKYWKHNHALVMSKELIDWQHYNTTTKGYNFVLAINKKDNEIHALQGYIPSSQFDQNIPNPVKWGAIWKSREDVSMPGLGMMLELFGYNNLEYKNYLAYGLSDMAISNYSKICNIGNTIQWYILNPYVSHYLLVKGNIPNICVNTNANRNSAFFKECDPTEYQSINSDVLNYIPSHKSKTYYINRYFNHPIYKYKATKILNSNNEIQAIFFWRICEHNCAKCIRIVDFFGPYDALIGHYNDFVDLLVKEDAEFVDFINAGIDRTYFEKSGFCDRSKSQIILANYFEPFLLENINLKYAWYSENNDDAPVIFKGDGDQDRPNLIEVK